MKTRRLFQLLSSALIAFAMAAGVAQAGPDETGSAVIDEPTGVPGLCDAPCYSVQKDFEFWLHDNPDNPLVSPNAGEHTYVYKLTHLGGSSTIFVPGVIGFNLVLDDTQVSDAGYILGSPGVVPSASLILTGQVKWEFLTLPITDGEMSALLYLHSPLLPGDVDDTMFGVQGQLSLDAQGTCRGPLIEPVNEVCAVSVEKEGCVVQPPDVTGDSCEGKLEAFCFEYTGLGCDASSHLQAPRKAFCAGGANGEEPVSIIVYTKKRKRWGWSHRWWGKKKKRRTVYAAESDVMVGDVICADSQTAGKHHFPSKTYVKISDGGGHHDIIEVDKFHTSCSQPFALGNQFGSVKIVSITSTEGGTVTLEEQEEEEEDACVTEIDQTPPPHCVGSVKKLLIRYTGTDCTATMTSQASHGWECVDPGVQTGDSVRIKITDSASPSSTVLFDDQPIEVGDIFEVYPDGSTFDPTTGFWVKDHVSDAVLQDGYFHTSCSKPLNLGDQFGSLQIYGIETTGGGTVTLGAEVEYTYTVTNDTQWPVVDVSVDDDKLGNIVSGATIPAMSSAVYTATATIEEETTNIATVTANGTSSGTEACMPGEDSATITVAEPPMEPTVCSKKISAMLLKYTGPDILGATVYLDAKNVSDTVTYGPIDLLNGTILSSPDENGFSIDGTAHGDSHLGSWVNVTIWSPSGDVIEKLSSSCCTPISTDAPAPLHSPLGDPSSNWFVVDFAEKTGWYSHPQCGQCNY